jgi:hemolysin activation/secretion protein
MLTGGYARIDPDITDFESHGKEAQASFRYKIPFKPLYTNFQHQLYFGFDYKYVTSILFFVSEITPQEAQNSKVNVTQEMLGYMFEYKPNRHELTFRIELFGSPVKWLPHQSTADYSALREDAKPRYFYGTATFGEIYTFSSRESIAGLLRVQGSANTLVPSEQFKLGGYNTVRGYEESVFISDNGVIANFEVRTRPFTFWKKMKDELTFLAFMDYGWGHNYHPFDGIKKTAILWGVGPGMRYTINPYVNLRVDYGFKLHHVHFDDHKLGMWHVGGTISY